MDIHSSLKKVNLGKYEYLYVYVKHRGSIIRINTGNKIETKYLNKDLSFNSKKENYIELNNQTKKLKQQVDDYLKIKMKNGYHTTISQKECLHYIKSGFTFDCNSEGVEKGNKSVDDHLRNFLQFKKEELSYRSSFKDYISFANSLTDYQKYYSVNLTLEMLDSLDFMVKYRNFLTIKKDETYLTRGGLNDNTINKRVSSLKTFFLWIEDKDLYQFKKSVQTFKTPKYENNVVVLDKDDLRQLLDLKIENQNWRKILDVFVCNCFLGLRYSDVSTLKKSDFVIDDDGDYLLVKENKKTGFTVQIPIQRTPLEILKRYDFNLPRFSQQHFNREIKKIFERYDLFSEVITKKRRVNKTNEDYEVKRRDLITSHSCRRSFVTLGISNNVPLNSLMLSTGHRKIQTLQNYMRKVIDKNSFKRIDL
jgi:integrase